MARCGTAADGSDEADCEDLAQACRIAWLGAGVSCV
jgi:hypothetical protein